MPEQCNPMRRTVDCPDQSEQVVVSVVNDGLEVGMQCVGLSIRERDAEAEWIVYLDEDTVLEVVYALQDVADATYGGFP